MERLPKLSFTRVSSPDTSVSAVSQSTGTNGSAPRWVRSLAAPRSRKPLRT